MDARPVSYIYDKRPVLTQQQMEDEKLSLTNRDECAHVYLRLRDCRFENFFLPWKCTEKRNALFRCEEKDFIERVNLRAEEKKRLEEYRKMEEAGTRLP